MAATTDEARTGLQVVATAAVAEMATTSAPAESPEVAKAALFALAPSVIPAYSDAAVALALDWFEELREEAAPSRLFVPQIILPDPDEQKIGRMVGWATRPLKDLTRESDALAEKMLTLALEDSMLRIQGEVQKALADAFRETIAGNASRDPAARGWARFARPGACPMCRMLAARGGVYTRSTARVAAHTNCQCIVRPVWDPNAPEVDVKQYVASSRERTPEQQRQLREYLHEHFDGPKPRDSATSPARKAISKALGLNSLTREQIADQIALTEQLKSSEWRTRQLARLRDRLAHL